MSKPLCPPDVAERYGVTPLQASRIMRKAGGRETGVYFLQCGETGPVKIGFSDFVSARIRRIQAMNPFELDVIGVIQGGDRRLERALHKRFDRLRIAGTEWFRYDRAITETLESLGVRT